MLAGCGLATVGVDTTAWTWMGELCATQYPQNPSRSSSCVQKCAGAVATRNDAACRCEISCLTPINQPRHWPFRGSMTKRRSNEGFSQKSYSTEMQQSFSLDVTISKPPKKLPFCGAGERVPLLNADLSSAALRITTSQFQCERKEKQALGCENSARPPSQRSISMSVVRLEAHPKKKNAVRHAVAKSVAHCLNNLVHECHSHQFRQDGC